MLSTQFARKVKRLEKRTVTQAINRDPNTCSLKIYRAVSSLCKLVSFEIRFFVHSTKLIMVICTI